MGAFDPNIILMSCPTNEPNVDFFVLRTPEIDENIRNPRIFLRKMDTCSCFAGPMDIKIYEKDFILMEILVRYKNANIKGNNDKRGIKNNL